jgi:hypothetical protein
MELQNPPYIFIVPCLRTEEQATLQPVGNQNVTYQLLTLELCDVFVQDNSVSGALICTLNSLLSCKGISWV